MNTKELALKISSEIKDKCVMRETVDCKYISHHRWTFPGYWLSTVMSSSDDDALFPIHQKSAVLHQCVSLPFQIPDEHNRLELLCPPQPLTSAVNKPTYLQLVIGERMTTLPHQYYWKTVSQNQAAPKKTNVAHEVTATHQQLWAPSRPLVSNLPADAGGRGVSCPALLVRGALLMTSYLLALLVPRFSLLMGLTGSVTGAAMSLILPCLLHLRLQWGRLTARERLLDVCILVLGAVCSVCGVICSVRRLVEGV